MRALLAYLAVEADRPHQRRKLSGLLWPEFPESTALSNLRYTLSNLRKVIGDRTAQPAYLEINPQEIRVNLSSNCLIDVSEFEGYCALAHQNPLDFISLNKAAELYRGRFLEGFTIPDSSAFEEWLVLKREHLDRLAIQVFGMVAHDYELAGDYQAAIHYAERQLELDPWREEVHRQLMRDLYFLGQRSAALAQYEACRKELATELEVEPELETRQLYRKIYEEKFTPPPTPPSFLRHLEPSRVGRPPFVSRQGPMNRLHQSLERAMAGHGQLLLVTGSPGQGKTVLVKEFMHQALQEYPGLAAAWGNSRAYFGSGDPYLPFRGILEMLTGQVEHLWEAGSISQEHALRMWRLAAYAIRALVQEGPALVGTFILGQALQQQASLVIQNETACLTSLRSLVNRQGGEPPPQQEALFQQYGRVLSAVAHHAPLLLFVDDLQWADPSSLALLFHLSRELKGAHIMIVVAFRPIEEVSAAGNDIPSLGTLINELRLLHGDVIINLDELEERSFIDEFLDLEPNRLEETFRQDLFRFTHGNPLFTIEMLFGMQERGDLAKNPQGQWVVTPSLRWDKIPPKVEAVIAERLRQLPGPLLELLQIASIEGERFTAEVTAKVQGAEVQWVLMQLSSELDRHHRLVQADSTRRVNGTRISRYRFRHILYQIYLYNQLNLVERARLHEQVGNHMEEYYSTMLAEVSIQLAIHFELANSPLKAIHYLNIAGIQATRLSSFEDAIIHLNKALSLMKLEPESLDKDLLELELLKSINVPLMHARGFASTDLGMVCNRMTKLLNRLPLTPEMFRVTTALCSYYTMRAEYRNALTANILGRKIAKSSGDEFNIHFMDFGIGLIIFLLGKIKRTLPRLEQMVEFYDRVKHGEIFNMIGTDPGIDSLTWASWILWLLGYADKALAYSNRAVDLGRSLMDPGCLAMSQGLAIFLRLFIKDTIGAADIIQSCSTVLEAHTLPLPASDLEFTKGYYQVLNGEAESGLASMIKGIEAYQAIGSRMMLSMHLTLLADAYLYSGQVEQAAKFLEQSEDFIGETGERFYQAETLRVKGEIVLLQDPANSEQAGDYFCQAMQVAHDQEAKTIELRAATSLARLRRNQGRRAEARRVLASVYDWFTEGFDTPDLLEAHALLETLTEKHKLRI